jgi:hypothetical protein
LRSSAAITSGASVTGAGGSPLYLFTGPAFPGAAPGGLQSLALPAAAALTPEGVPAVGADGGVTPGALLTHRLTGLRVGVQSAIGLDAVIGLRTQPVQLDAPNLALGRATVLDPAGPPPTTPSA